MREDDFKIFYESYAKTLWAYALRLTGDASLADDIVQESFIRLLHRDIDSLTDAQRKSYLFQTATNLFRDHLRKTKRTVAWDDVDENVFMKTAVYGEAVDFTTAFDQLPPQQRTLLWMAYAEDYTHEEIAHALELKPSSVKVLLFRAKKKLTDVLTRLGISKENRHD